MLGARRPPRAAPPACGQAPGRSSIASRLQHQQQPAPAAPTRPRPPPATRHEPVAAVSAVRNTGATAQPRLPVMPCTEKAWPRRGADTRLFRMVKSTGWNGELPRPGQRGRQHQPGVALRPWRPPARPARSSPAPRTAPAARRRGRPGSRPAPGRCPRSTKKVRDQQAELGVAQAEVADEQREQRRQQHVEEVRGAVRQADQADGLASWRRERRRRSSRGCRESWPHSRRRRHRRSYDRTSSSVEILPMPAATRPPPHQRAADRPAALRADAGSARCAPSCAAWPPTRASSRTATPGRRWRSRPPA